MRGAVNERASGRAGEHLLDAEDAEAAAASGDAGNGGGRGWTGSWRRRRDPAVPGRIWPGTTARSCVGAPRGQWQLLLPEERREREIFREAERKGEEERRRGRRAREEEASGALATCWSGAGRGRGSRQGTSSGAMTVERWLEATGNRGKRVEAVAGLVRRGSGRIPMREWRRRVGGDGWIGQPRV